MANSTLSNSTLTAEEWNSILTPERIPLMFATLLLFIVGCCGNIIVIVVYKLRMESQEGRFYIPYLAVSDLVAITITSTFLLMLDGLEAVLYSNSLCKFFQFLNWSAVQNSILMLFLVALHRYLLICHPMKPRLSTRGKRILLCCVTGFSVCVSIPLAIFSSRVTLDVHFRGKDVQGYFCSFNHGSYPKGEKIYQGLLFGGNMIFLALTTLLYIPIGRVVFRMSDKKGLRKSKQGETSFNECTGTTQETSNSRENITSSSEELDADDIRAISRSKTESKPEEKRRQQQSVEIRRKFTISLMMVVLFYILSYIPFYVIIFNGINDLDVWFNLRPTSLNGYLFLNRIYMLNNVMNPIMYSMFDVVFRDELFKLIRQCCRNN